MPPTDRFEIDADVRRSFTLPGSAYRDPEVFAKLKESVFARSWHLAGHESELPDAGAVKPFMLLPGVLDVPLVLTRDAEGRIHAFSNVCTHRGAIVCDGPGTLNAFRCRYHGRRFALDGRFLSMPEFEGAEGFPSPSDDLPHVALSRFGGFLFVSLDPEVPFDAWIAPMRSRAGFLPFEKAVLDTARSRAYDVAANWALYVDNYLEGFHIPYVHPTLAKALDYGSYRTELFDFSTLQVGVAETDDDVFTLPESSPDAGARVAGYYFWLFPNTMFNLYPWGISVNVVEPVALERMRVVYETWVWDPARLDRGAGSGLDRVEHEDEAVVESVQKGIRSRLYRRGRFSPTRETGVHRFHRLLAERA